VESIQRKRNHYVEASNVYARVQGPDCARGAHRRQGQGRDLSGVPVAAPGLLTLARGVSGAAPEVLATQSGRGDEQEQVAALERMVGRLTMELEVARKASDISNSVYWRRNTMVDPGIAAAIGALISAIGSIIVALIQSSSKPQPEATPAILGPDGSPIRSSHKLRSFPWKTVPWIAVIALLGGIAGYALGKSAEPSPLSGPKLGDTQLRSADGMVMVYVPAGTFDMGSSNHEIDRELQLCNLDSWCERSSFESEQPVHTVYMDAFWIDRTEITNAQYQLCVATGECSPPTDSRSNVRASYFGNEEYDDYPVIHVSWDQAANYCKWIGGRLPTEAEWEYAARGPQRYIFPWGNERPDNTLLNYSGNVGDTTQVGTYQDGASWCGVLDMAGNAWEWVNDWFSYDYYKRSPPQNPIGPAAGEVHVLRGGAWNSNQYRVRMAQRDYYTDEWSPLHLVGFRCVVSQG